MLKILGSSPAATEKNAVLTPALSLLRSLGSESTKTWGVNPVWSICSCALCSSGPGSSFKLTKELEDDVYFAYNTLSNYESSENGKLEAQSEIVVLVKTSSKDKISISHEVVDFSDLDLAVLKLKRDTEIDGEYEAELVLSSATTSTVTDINGQERTITNKDGKTFKIPLRIK